MKQAQVLTERDKQRVMSHVAIGSLMLPICGMLRNERKFAPMIRAIEAIIELAKAPSFAGRRDRLLAQRISARTSNLEIILQSNF